MTLVDVAAALQEGSLPTNPQLLAFLQAIHRSTSLNPPAATTLSKEKTRSLLSDDVKELIEALCLLVQDKNGTEEIQSLIWIARGQKLNLGVPEERSDDVPQEQRRESTEATVTSGTTSQERKEERRRKAAKKLDDAKLQAKLAGARSVQTGRTAASHLFTLGRLLLVQPELRHLFSDLLLLGVEVMDQTVSDTLGEDARKDLGQVVDAHRGTVEGIIASAKDHRGPNGPLNGAAMASRLREQATDLLARQGQTVTSSLTQDFAQRFDAMPAQAPNLMALKDRLVRTTELLQRKRRGEAIDMELPSLDEIRLLLTEELARGLEIPTELRSLMNGSTDAVGPNCLASYTSTPPAAGNGHDPVSDGSDLSTHSTPKALSRSDIMDMLQLVGVDTALAQVNTIQCTLKSARLRADDVARKAKAEGLKNAKLAWQNQGQQRALARFRKLLVDVQSAETSREAFLWFLERFEAAARYLAHVSIDVPGRATEFAEEALRSLGPIASLLGRFAGGVAIKEIAQLLRHLSIGYREDPELRGFLADCDAFLRRCATEPGYVMDPACESQGHELKIRLQTSGVEYRADLQRLIQLLRTFFTAAPRDPVLLALKSSVSHLARDLTMGRQYFYLPSKQIWHDLINDILPPIFNKATFPIPRVKYTHPDFVLVLENLAVSLEELIPDFIDFKMTNDLHLDVKQLRSSTHCHRIKLKIKGMSLRVHKVAFAVDVLKGMTFHDKGIVDLFIKDVGLSIVLDIPKETGQDHFFLVHKVKGKLGRLQVAVRQSNHSILHKIAEGLIDSKLTKMILRRLMAKGVTLGLQQLDIALLQWKLNPTPEEPEIKRSERLKKQMSELRDLMVKLREEAGTLEIDFLERDGTSASRIGGWKDSSKLWKWSRDQFGKTGTREVIRHEWRSNVFDLKDETVEEGFSAAEATAALHPPEAAEAAAPAGSSNQATETEAEAEAAGKTGPTTQATVQDADETLHQQERKYWPWFRKTRASAAVSSEKKDQ